MFQLTSLIPLKLFLKSFELEIFLSELLNLIDVLLWHPRRHPQQNLPTLLFTGDSLFLVAIKSAALLHPSGVNVRDVGLILVLSEDWCQSDTQHEYVQPVVKSIVDESKDKLTHVVAVFILLPIGSLIEESTYECIQVVAVVAVTKSIDRVVD